MSTVPIEDIQANLSGILADLKPGDELSILKGAKRSVV